MKLIIGGAYQGKLDYAKEHFHITDEDVFNCVGAEIDFSRHCINAIEEFTLACVRSEQDPQAYFARYREAWADSVLICQDISCGVVPMERELRRWRDATGRLCQYLSAEAEQVSRIFCGLEQRLK